MKIRSLLIANRGEIAVRIIRTARALGIRAVAIYSDADRRALHVLEADEAVYVGASPPAESYLAVERIVAAARRSNADAIHPGYGFLSERPEFSEACRANGIVFVGPPANVIRAMGNKAEARRLAASLGVPTVPGFDGDGDDDRLALEAGRIGYPVMVKAAAGGGGRGMRRVEHATQLAPALEGARREALRAFGDGRVFLERLVTDARHVEVQVIADAYGQAAHLGERDCSVQRRHQKVIEESPSPALDDALRAEVTAAALRLVSGIGYQNVGTVEFLFDPVRREFYFLEMNTRLQVEHGVTELVTGEDIVALQIQVAAGMPLPSRLSALPVRGHAIECRLYAENPETLLPDPGRVSRFHLPSGEGIRVDAGIAAGADIPPDYDALLAKILVKGTSRSDAIQRMRRALDATMVEGVATNLPLLQAIVASPRLAAGEVSTGFLDSEERSTLSPAGVPEEIRFGALAAVVSGAGAERGTWEALGTSGPSGWIDVTLAWNGVPFRIEARRVIATTSRYALAGSTRTVIDVARISQEMVVAEVDGRTWAFHVRRDALGIELSRDDATYRLTWYQEKGASERTRRDDSGRGIVAPMTGRVVRLLVSEGERVAENQALAVVEAMKMEHTLYAPRAGVVRAVLYQVGQQVNRGSALLQVE